MRQVFSSLFGFGFCYRDIFLMDLRGLLDPCLLAIATDNKQDCTSSVAAYLSKSVVVTTALSRLIFCPSGRLFITSWLVLTKSRQFITSWLVFNQRPSVYNKLVGFNQRPSIYNKLVGFNQRPSIYNWLRL